MNAHQKNSESNTDTYGYSSSEFIYQTASWADTSAPQLSKFDIELHKRWDHAMSTGVFRYNIDHIVTRILPGDKHYVGQLNTLRATERRKPQVITSVKQPFNPDAFNFTWVKPEEVIFNLKNLDTSQPQHPQSGCNWEVSCNGTAASHHPTDSQGALESHGAPDSQGAPERHTLVVNVSPMEYGHCLLVPQIDSHQPQILTLVSIQVALETMLLSRHRGFRMGYNSLCAFASVNHLHFHVYYLEYQLIVDYCPVNHLGGKIYEITAIPCPGFVLQLHNSSVQEMARLTHKISSYFQTNDIAHNIFICRGVVFGEARDSSQTTIRLFIWPRKKFIGNKSSEDFNVACIELGGHLPIKEVDGYNTLTEADVDDIIADACLPPDQYQKIKSDITKLGLEEDS